MAYVFSNINSMMGQQPDQSNIFAQGGQNASQPAGQQDVSNLSPTQGAGGSSAQSSGSSGPSSVQKAQSMVNDQSIYTKNKDNAPQLAQNFQKQESDVGGKLQDEANSYMSANKGLGAQGNLSAEQVQNDVNTGNFGEISSRLSGATPQAQAFNSSVNASVPNLDALKSQAGIQGLFYNQGNETYGKGMAALDSSLLGQNQGFKQQRGELFDKQQQLKDLQMSNNQNLQGQAQNQINQDYTQGTNQIRGTLGNIEDELSKNAGIYNAGLNRETEAARAALVGGNSQYLEDQTRAAKQGLASDLGADPTGNAKLIAMLPQLGVPNAGQYLNFRGELGGNTGYTDQQAQQYNQINALLGRGGPAAVARGDAGQAQTFNQQAYKDALMKLANQQLALQPQNAAAGPVQHYASGGVASSGNTILGVDPVEANKKYTTAWSGNANTAEGRDKLSNRAEGISNAAQDIFGR